MIHYSIIPIEQIYADSQTVLPARSEIQLGRKLLQVEWTGPQQAKIVRLISPCAEDYLDPKYFPGSMLAFVPQ